MIVTVTRGWEWNVLTTKFSRWERHRAEYAARIVFFYGNALFFGNAIFGCLNKILCTSYNANNREDAERNCEITFSTSSISTTDTVKGKRRFEARKYGLGEVIFTATTAASAFIYALNNTSTEEHRCNDFDNCRGFVLFVTFLGGAAAKILAYAVALKNADIALATVKDYALFKYRNPLNLL